MRGIAVAWAICSVVLLSQPASAEKRVALVIGNSAYQNVGRLSNPANDAAAITTILKDAHFDVVDSRRDLSTTEMRKTLREFTSTARDADVAVVYYAGHGIEVDGANYLIPVDAQLETDTDVFDEAFPLDRILVAVEPARQLRLVILDACRDNPFAKTMKRTIGSRAVGRGLARVEPSSPNTMVAFAARAGSTASDGGGGNSPFAAALVNHLTKPGLDLRKAFGFVRDDVLKATGNKQEPFVYGSLGGNDVALVPAAAPAAPDVAKPASPAIPALTGSSNADARRDYEFALSVGSKAVWDAFIADYPKGLYTELAKAQRGKVAAEEARQAAAEKARAAEEEKARLLAEGARAAEQARANAQAKAAEEAMLAAEKKKAAEDARVAEAERARAAAQARTAEAERIKAAAAAKPVETAKPAADKATDADKPAAQLAALAPAERSPESEVKTDPPAAVDIPRLLQSELRRVGCNTGTVDGNWNAAAQKSLTLFNKHAGMKLDVKVASLDALDAIRLKPARVCPLICEHGFKADGERCSKITCRAGYEVGDDNECEKIEAKRPEKKRDQPVAAKPQQAASTAKPAAPSGQIFCSSTIGGCRPVRKGCHVTTGNQEACN